MAYIRIKAEVKGNIIISGTPIIANHVDSADYISGSILRGAISQLWKKEHLGNSEFLDYFCRGKIRFRGLFPIPSGNEGINFMINKRFPFRMPLSAFACKYEGGMERWGHGFIDAAIMQDSRECSICDAPLKQCKEIPFYYMSRSDNSKPVPINTKKEIYIYHGTDRSTKRATDAALYSYTSVCEGERYLGWLTGKKGDLDGFLECIGAGGKTTEEDNKIECSLRIGRAKKRRGYLKCSLEVVTSDENEGETGHPLLNDEAAPVLSKDGYIIVTLQTPVILYDSLYRPEKTIKPEKIFKDEIFNSKVEKVNEFTMKVEIDGWSSVHRLPRKPDTAISAGSTFVFKIDRSFQSNSKDKILEPLKTIQKRGIGERINEGYGQILINPPFHRKDNSIWQP